MRHKRKIINNALIILSVFAAGLLFQLTDIYAKEFSPDINDLITAYPNHISNTDGNYIIWKDGTKMPFDDGKKGKTFEELLRDADLEDQLSLKYPAGGAIDTAPAENFDPGRFRYEPLFKKMYGNSKKAVEKNLVTIEWMPKSVKRKVRFSKVNNAHLALKKVSDDLDRLPDGFKKYVTHISGTYNWRNIAGTNRISTHSFGISIDINVKLSHYWYWTKPDKSGKYPYKNGIPLEIISIFEKHGFIWGGRWYHYDTMHFEYRPELFIDASRVK